MHKKVLVTMLSALALTACGGEDNQSASTTNKSVMPLQLRHVTANYNPAEVCRDLKKTWDKKLSSKSEQVTCAYFPAPLNMPASPPITQILSTSFICIIGRRQSAGARFFTIPAARLMLRP